MSASVMIDLVIAAVFLLCVWLGAKRGLFRSLAELAIIVVALLAAAQAARYGTELVVEQMLRPATEAAIEQRVDEMMAEGVGALSPLEEMEQVVDAIPNDFIRQQAEKLLGDLGVSAQTAQHAGREALLDLAGQLVDTVLESIVHSLVYALLYLTCFALVSLVLRLAVRALDLTFRLPVLHQLNTLGGVLFGAAKGAILIWLGLWVLGSMGLVTPEIQSGSYLLRILADGASMAGYPVA